jgi:hypothetical protein
MENIVPIYLQILRSIWFCIMGEMKMSRATMVFPSVPCVKGSIEHVYAIFLNNHHSFFNVEEGK